MRAINERRASRAPVARLAVVLGAILLVMGMFYLYWQNADEAQKRQLDALRQVVAEDLALPLESMAAGSAPAVTGAPLQETPAQADLAAKSEPAVVPVADALPLPTLDEADAAIRAELAALTGWPAAAAGLLAGDQLLRRFVAAVANLAAGKIDHKSGPLLPPRAGFAVTSGIPIIQGVGSEARYKPYVLALTSLDVAQCAQLYRRYYPLLNEAWAELGERGSLHAALLKGLQHLLATPAGSTSPVLLRGEKGLYHYADPALEALSPAQKQLLRAGNQNRASLLLWLRQLYSALTSATP